tara:strand:+ start:209 stop:505 length:297 start_codon:yes stop_codon:yes gene_type:complete
MKYHIDPDLLDRVAAIDPDLADELDSDAMWRMRVIENTKNVAAARERLCDVQREYAYDMTGQDGEMEADAAAADYVRAQDDKIRDEDPERWAEMQMGA